MIIDSKDSKDSKVSTDSKDCQDSKDNEDSKYSEDGEDGEDSEDSEDSKDFKDSKDGDNGNCHRDDDNSYHVNHRRDKDCKGGKCEDGDNNVNCTYGDAGVDGNHIDDNMKDGNIYSITKD